MGTEATRSDLTTSGRSAVRALRSAAKRHRQRERAVRRVHPERLTAAAWRQLRTDYIDLLVAVQATDDAMAEMIASYLEVIRHDSHS